MSLVAPALPRRVERRGKMGKAPPANIVNGARGLQSRNGHSSESFHYRTQEGERNRDEKYASCDLTSRPFSTIRDRLSSSDDDERMNILSLVLSPSLEPELVPPSHLPFSFSPGGGKLRRNANY